MFDVFNIILIDKTFSLKYTLSYLRWLSFEIGGY